MPFSPSSLLGVVAIFLGAGLSPLVAAGLLVYEGFGYEAGSGLEGQGGGMGFGNSWQRGYSGKVDLIIEEGLAFSDYPVTGKAAVANSGGAEFESASAIRPLAVDWPAAPTPVWASYLFCYGRPPGTSGPCYADVSTGNNSKPDDRRFGLGALGGSNTFRAVYQSPEEANSVEENSPGTTYLVIGKYVGGVGVTLWALSEADYDAIKPGGITEEELRAFSIYIVA